MPAESMHSCRRCANNIYLNGNEEQRARFLPGLCAGTTVGALGMSEPGAGSDAIGSMSTRATRNGDHYILNGTKLWITNGPVADVVLVYAKTAPERGNQGVSAFLVEKGMEGFSVGKKQDKMGFRGSPQSELVFEDVKVRGYSDPASLPSPIPLHLHLPLSPRLCRSYIAAPAATAVRPCVPRPSCCR
jgi:alkylation response protein AidB-like acyl-CoA dehydrogenase